MPTGPVSAELALSTRRPWLKINHGLVNLGRFGVCGMAWQWHGPGQPRGIEQFVRVMNRIPVATNKAFNTFWKNRAAVCDQLLALFNRADKLEFEEFKKQVAEIFAGIGLIVVAFPNNHFGLQQGWRAGGSLLRLQKEVLDFKQATLSFQNDPGLKTLFYQQHGLDLFQITEPMRQALCYRWEEHDYGITGRIVIEEAKGSGVTDWMVNRHGRRDYHIRREALEQITWTGPRH